MAMGTLILAGMLVLWAIPTTGPTAPPKIEVTVPEPRALSFPLDGAQYGQAINGMAFQQDVLRTVHGRQYVTFYDADGLICVSRRDVSGATPGEWQTVRLPSKIRNAWFPRGGEPKGRVWGNTHNTISMGIAEADGSIHLCFDHHGSVMRYVRSQPGIASESPTVAWDVAGFLPEQDWLVDGRRLRGVTYPQFTPTPDGTLQISWRHGGSGDGDYFLSTYDPATATWATPHQFIAKEGIFRDEFNESKFRCAYLNGTHYGPDGRLHMTWCWRETTQGANHDICYAYSDDRGQTWKNDAGEVIAAADGEPIRLESPGITVVPLDRRQTLMNAQHQAIDSQGRVHVLMWHRKPGVEGRLPWDESTSSYFHYVRIAPGRWERREAHPRVGARPRIALDRHDNAYAVFIRETMRDRRFPPAQTPTLVVCRATAASGWTDWSPWFEIDEPFMGDPAVDAVRLLEQGVLSIVAQIRGDEAGNPSPLKVIEVAVPR
jgi:hypothetical protein